MKKILIGFPSLLLLSLSLAACQGAEEQTGNNTDEPKATEVQEKEIHDHSDGAESQAPIAVDISGLGLHYHTGDEIKLTAILDEETQADHWHWYSRESNEKEWNVVSGQTTDTFTGTAETDGTEIKAVLFDESEEPVFQSEAVKVAIDDHHDHGHDHGEANKQIYEGYFDDSQVKSRELSDWEGDWQSIYPYLQAGDLDEVFEHKAETGDMTAEEYKEYYTVGYVTDVDRITIDGDRVTFYENGTEYSGNYESDGYEILTYEKGNRGVRFIFKLVEGSTEAPQYIQFSDHNIFPVDSHHYHLYWGDNREELLEEVTHWPTYYPSDLDADGLLRDMLAH
ncbi:MULTISPECIES: metal-binding protein ZinT [unclassified Exiguobacterium]|uniref:metal-binding protein ZinT n=1 Tax=unclassified Exiguobacterium TaxID=2644629 RepID=UPI001BECA281|nr:MULTISPECIES: metal-binding protein ZinT [unclassified Exiguobacterium]